MTTPQNTPPAPQDGPPPSQGQPPPAPPPEPQDGGQGQPAPDADSRPAGDPAELRTALEDERKRRIALDRELAKLRQQSMTDQEKAVETARAEGRAEAIKAAGVKLAAAEFKAAAAGKLADPAAAVELLDLSKFVGEDGDPDSAALAALVDKLAAQLHPNGQPGRVPPGPRQSTADADFLRSAMGR